MTTGFNIDLRHQYGISVAESQTFLLAKRAQRQGARRNGCFRRLVNSRPDYKEPHGVLSGLPTEKLLLQNLRTFGLRCVRQLMNNSSY